MFTCLYETESILHLGVFVNLDGCYSPYNALMHQTHDLLEDFGGQNDVVAVHPVQIHRAEGDIAQKWRHIQAGVFDYVLFTYLDEPAKHGDEVPAREFKTTSTPRPFVILMMPFEKLRSRL